MKPFSASDYLTTIPLAHQMRRDGLIEVTGTIHISNQNLQELPDLSCVILNGSFFCDGNQLTSLKGIPQSITGHFDCKHNRIDDISHLPRNAASMVFDRATYDLLRQEVKKYNLEVEDIAIIGNAIQVDGAVLPKLYDAKQHAQEIQQTQAERALQQNIHDTCHKGTGTRTMLVKKIVLKP